MPHILIFKPTAVLRIFGILPLYFSATLCWIQIMQTLAQRNASSIHSTSCLWNHHSVKLRHQMEQLILLTQQPSVMGLSHRRATSHGQYVVSINRNQVPDIHLIYSQIKRTRNVRFVAPMSEQIWTITMRKISVKPYFVSQNYVLKRYKCILLWCKKLKAPAH